MKLPSKFDEIGFWQVGIRRNYKHMFSKCVNCNFFVSGDDSICPNCGLSDPTIELNQGKTILGNILYLFAGIVAFIITVIFTFIYQTVLPIDIIAIFMMFFSIFAIVIFAYSENQIDKKNLVRLTNNGFNEKEKIIQRRVFELTKRRQNIDLVLAKIKETDSQNLQNVRIRLLKAREIVVSQSARYQLQKRKIEIVRLQNTAKPYLFGWQHLNDSETENGLVTIENTRQETDKIRQNLTNSPITEFPQNVLPEKQNLLAQLLKTETSFEQLREALLSRQAVRALQEISPLEENLKLPNADGIVHAAETFNVQTTLTDFSESFDELEREYQRLKAEEEIGQKLLEN